MISTAAANSRSVAQSGNDDHRSRGEPLFGRGLELPLRAVFGHGPGQGVGDLFPVHDPADNLETLLLPEEKQGLAPLVRQSPPSWISEIVSEFDPFGGRAS